MQLVGGRLVVLVETTEIEGIDELVGPVVADLIGQSEALEAVDWSAFACLRSVDLSLSRELRAAGALGACVALRVLNLAGCAALGSVDGLGASATLESLRLSSCGALIDVAPLATCAALHTIHLEHCRSLTDATPLGACAALRNLHVRCSAVVCLPQKQNLAIFWDDDSRSVVASRLQG